MCYKVGFSPAFLIDLYMEFPEEFLQFIWQFSLLNTMKISGTRAEAIRIIRPGRLNKNAGPDFLQAKLSINDVLWVGNVEIHYRASDWIGHGHHTDEQYNTVILHVVYEADAEIYRTDGTRIPVLLLRGLFDEKLRDRYTQLLHQVTYLPCENHLKKLDPFLVEYFLTRVGVERLVQKSEEVFERLEHYKGDWNETFYYFLLRCFGYRINTVPMEMLAGALPGRLLTKHKDHPGQIEALIFGQSGFLEQRLTDSYPVMLKTEYEFLRKKYKLKPMNVSLWKFMRMRPQHFPTLRLAQISGLIAASGHLFSEVLIRMKEQELTALFRDLPVNAYWLTHYHFNKETKRVSVQLGDAMITNVLINVVSLFLFSYGKYTGQYALIERAIALLEQLPAEKNAIVTRFSRAGFPVHAASSSQAVLQLRHHYCDQKRCLYCGIGNRIIRQGE